MKVTLADELRTKIHHHLNQIYENRDNEKLTKKIISIFFEGHDPIFPNPNITKWDQKDVILITYANSVIEKEKAPKARPSKRKNQDKTPMRANPPWTTRKARDGLTGAPR